MKLILKCLKFVLLTALILLLGQIRIGRETIASMLQKQVARGLDWTAGQIRSTSVYRAMPKFAHSSEAPKGKLVAKHKVAPAPSAPPQENITAADQDSLMRLLE